MSPRFPGTTPTTLLMEQTANDSHIARDLRSNLLLRLKFPERFLDDDGHQDPAETDCRA